MRLTDFRLFGFNEDLARAALAESTLAESKGQTS